MTDTHAALIESLVRRIEDKGLNLPTLPDVALRVRSIAEDPDSTATELANAIAHDPAIAARLVQIANSPLYRGLSEITSLPQIVTRLGMRTISQLVVLITMQQSFRAHTPVIQQRMRRHWEYSTQVSALAQMLARKQRHLDPDQALLARLTHAIGTLPVYAIAEDLPKLLHHPDLLDQLATELQPRLGGQILRAWGFPEPLVDVGAAVPGPATRSCRPRRLCRRDHRRHPSGNKRPGRTGVELGRRAGRREAGGGYRRITARRRNGRNPEGDAGLTPGTDEISLWRHKKS